MDGIAGRPMKATKGTVLVLNMLTGLPFDFVETNKVFFFFFLKNIPPFFENLVMVGYGIIKFAPATSALHAQRCRLAIIVMFVRDNFFYLSFSQ